MVSHCVTASTAFPTSNTLLTSTRPLHRSGRHGYVLRAPPTFSAGDDLNFFVRGWVVFTDDGRALHSQRMALCRACISDFLYLAHAYLIFWILRMLAVHSLYSPGLVGAGCRSGIIKHSARRRGGEMKSLGRLRSLNGCFLDLKFPACRKISAPVGEGARSFVHALGVPTRRVCLRGCWDIVVVMHGYSLEVASSHSGISQRPRRSPLGGSVEVGGGAFGIEVA